METAPRQSRHIPALDGVRGLAILLVIAHHAGAFPSGWVGVDLFFVLSGYLITGILVRAKDGPGYFRTFWMRRALRIVPASVAFLAAVLLALPALRHTPLPTGQAWVWSYLTNVAVALHGWGEVPAYVRHLWSLAVEEQFYLVWPIVVLLCSMSTLRRVSALAIPLALLLRVALAWRGAELAAYVLMPTRMDALLVGAWLAVTPVSPRSAVRVGLPALLATVAVLWGREAQDALAATIGYTLIAVSAGGLLVLAVESPAVASVLSWRVLRVAGKYSYAAYLWHIIVLMQLGKRAGVTPGWLAFFVGTLATFAVAWGSWRLIEAPFLALKRRFPEGKAEREKLCAAA